MRKLSLGYILFLGLLLLENFAFASGNNNNFSPDSEATSSPFIARLYSYEVEENSVKSKLDSFGIPKDSVSLILKIHNGKQSSVFKSGLGETFPQLMLHCSTLKCSLGLGSKGCCDLGSCGVCGIAKDSHRLKFCSGGNYGRGLYFADEFTSVMGEYMENRVRGPLGVVILTYVNLGRIGDVQIDQKLEAYKESSRPRIRDNLESPPPGYDSIKNYWEHVVYDERRVCPAYLVFLNQERFEGWRQNQDVILRKDVDVDGVSYPLQIEDNLESGNLINSSGVYKLFPCDSLRSYTNYNFKVWGYDTSGTASMYVARKPKNRGIRAEDEVVWTGDLGSRLSSDAACLSQVNFNSGFSLDPEEYEGWFIGVLRRKSSAISGKMNLLSYSLREVN